MEEIFILDRTEFMILAIAVGFTELYGVRVNEQLDQTQMTYCIHEMAQKGILQSNGEVLTIQEPFRTALLTMKNAERITAVTSSSGECENICFYIGEKVVSLGVCEQDKAAFRIGLYERDALCEVMERKGCLPEPLVSYDIAMMQSKEEFMETISSEEIPEEKIRVRYLVQNVKERQGRQKEIFLLNDPFNYWIAEKYHGQKKFYHYSKEVFFKKLTEDIN